MNPNQARLRICGFCTAVMLAGSLCAGNLLAKDHDITVALRVSAAGLDLSRLEDAQKFYMRLKNAAWVVCTGADRVGLESVDNPAGCAEKSLGAAIASLDSPAMTQIYLATHTLQQAANYGIRVRLQAATR